MMKLNRPAAFALLLASLLSACAHAPAASRQDALASMVNAELAFAAAAGEVGPRHAFLRFMSDSAVLFRGDTATYARPVWERRPPGGPGLAWYPSHAVVAASGDLGFTTGPYELAGPQRRYGTFVTVWRREGDGWRFMIDMGAPAGGPPDPVPARRSPSGAARTPLAGIGLAGSDVRASLLAADRAFGEHAGAHGAAEAVRRFGAADVRVLREGAYAAVGQEAAAARLAAPGKTHPSHPLAAHASRAGDFGYTYGLYRVAGATGDTPPETGHYLRIWTRAPRGEWKVVMDVNNANPVPRQE
jgi:ketosteroid isomerase-like protein